MDSTVPAVAKWFASRGWRPLPFQERVWTLYRAGESGLLYSATGTGKTYAVWLGPVQEWLDETVTGRTPPSEPLRILWITPLRALAADTEAALRAPLRDLAIPWSVETRTGDTPAAARRRQKQRLPTALITTPESLSILLSFCEMREAFSSLRLIVVDEWHELLSTKRGTQTELALARLRNWNPRLVTWGLSATLGNLEQAKLALLGPEMAAEGHLVNSNLEKQIIIESLIPERIERFPWAGHLGMRLVDRVVERISTSRTTLLFTNTRFQAESWYTAIRSASPPWAGAVAIHHGSLDAKLRARVQSAVGEGELRCVVCTSSMDLGVDFWPVDQVIQVGSPKGIARLLQRAGRSGHQPGVPSRIVCVPTNALELLELSAARKSVLAGRLEDRVPLEKPLDVLTQHLVTIAAGGGFEEPQLYREVRASAAYASLTPEEWEWALDFVTTGGRALHAYPQYGKVKEVAGHFEIAEKAGVGRHRVSIGTITSNNSLKVAYLSGRVLGTVEESFAGRLKPGDTFTLAGRQLELVRVREMTAWVRKTSAREGPIPRWMGGRMPLSTRLSEAVRSRLNDFLAGIRDDDEIRALEPVLEIQSRWSRIPGEDELLIERIRTREGFHLFFYPFEGRLVHEGLAALFAFRLSRLKEISFSLAANDYGFELVSNVEPPLEGGLDKRMLEPLSLIDDIEQSLNASEMARRQFREIARVAGLVFQGFPGGARSPRDMQASSSLLFDVFGRYDPGNLLVHQARREVRENQLEFSRLHRTLSRLSHARLLIQSPPQLTPFAFPIMVGRLRERLSSEELEKRVERMTLRLGRAADSKESPSPWKKPQVKEGRSVPLHGSPNHGNE